MFKNTTIHRYSAKDSVPVEGVAPSKVTTSSIQGKLRMPTTECSQ